MFFLFEAFSVALPQATLDPFVIGVQIMQGNRALIEELPPNGQRSVCPVFIGGVTKNSPAAKAGLEPGDVLEAVDGAPVNFHWPGSGV